MKCRFCPKTFQPQSVPCPERIEGCQISHATKTSHICPSCGKDNSQFAWDTVFYGDWLTVMDGVREAEFEQQFND